MLLWSYLGPFFLLWCQGCGERCGPTPSRDPSSVSDIEWPELEHPEKISGSANEVIAIDDERVIVLSGNAKLGVRLSLFKNGRPSWSRLMPCRADDWSNIHLVADPEIAALRCPLKAGSQIGTLALSTHDGSISWTGGLKTIVGDLELDSVMARRAGDFIVNARDRRGAQVLRLSTGREIWADEGEVMFDYWRIPGVLFDAGPQWRFRDLRGDKTITGRGRVLGAFEEGICAFDQGVLSLTRVDGQKRVLATEETIATLRQSGFQPFSPLSTRCGHRGNRTVLVIDADSHILVAVIAQDGTLVGQRHLPPTSGPPILPGWNENLPRFYPIVTGDGVIHVIDLDEFCVVGTQRTLAQIAGSGFELTRVQWRRNAIIWLSGKNRLFALHGEQGSFLAIEKTLPQYLNPRAIGLRESSTWIPERTEGVIEFTRHELNGATPNTLAKRLNEEFERVQGDDELDR